MSSSNLRTDLSQAAVLDLETIPWESSPAAAVERKKLEREFAEAGRTTSLVRYGPGASFSEHTHGGGEEFLVLEGVFQDQHGNYPAGSYVRNPIGSSHVPFSESGCLIFVKLCQMRQEQDLQLVESLSQTETEQLLYQDSYEKVSMLRLPMDRTLQLAGKEVLVVEGMLRTQGKNYPSYSWLRFPSQQSTFAVSLATTTLWIKEKHLP